MPDANAFARARPVFSCASRNLEAARRETAPSKPTCRAPTPSDRSAIELPVHRVVLYKNGVGYFEHAGRVRGSQDLSIRFTTAQLNDVLKSLTVVDLAGQVTSVRYNSIAPLSERLSTLRVQLLRTPPANNSSTPCVEPASKSAAARRSPSDACSPSIK